MNSYSVWNFNYHKFLLTILNNKNTWIQNNSLIIGIPPQPQTAETRKVLIYVGVVLLVIRSHTSDNIILYQKYTESRLQKKGWKICKITKWWTQRGLIFVVGKCLFIEFKGWYNPSIKLAYKLSRRHPQGIQIANVPINVIYKIEWVHSLYEIV